MRILPPFPLSVLCAVHLICAPTPAVAQQRGAQDDAPDSRHFSFYDRGPYRPNVPRPEQILGYELGDWNTQYSDQERVLLAIANAAQDRVRVEEFGSTYERRTMRLFIVSSPDNIARMDAIRADLDRLADPRGVSRSELDALIARTPVVTWISFSVHGNESPGFETVMQLLYQLAASEEPATLDALRSSVVVLNPSSNPDGHERFSVWYNSVAVWNPDPGANEHSEPWSIQGRFNHYRFDMNRDVIATTQREVQGMVRAMLRWHPMVTVDQHGQTTQYFFPPAALPVNENLSRFSSKWLDIIGRGNAAAFDRYGWPYYVRDIFDLYYPGYWDTWPSLTGATGMTYETDGGGWKGIRWRRDDGTLLTFRDGIAKHYVAGLATIETVAERAQERLRDYVAFRQGAIDDGRTGRMKRFVLLPGDDPARAAELASTLVRAGIEVRRADRNFSSSRAHSLRDGSAGSRSFPSGAYVIDLAQPQGKVAKAILEPNPELDPTFARTQIERYRRNLRRAPGVAREGYEFYDVTAWSLPVAFGVDSYWTEDASAVSGPLLDLAAEEPSLPDARRRAKPGGEGLAGTGLEGGVVSGANARAAYVFSPQRTGAHRLAYALMAEGFRVSVATEPIEAAGRNWPRGTFVLRVTRNDSTIHSRIDELAREAAVDVTGVETAFTSEAQFGVGSEAVASLHKPEVAVVGDYGVSQTSYGALWWSFERRFGIPFTPVSFAYLAGGDLSRFTTIIIPSASGGMLTARLGDRGVERLKSWISGGGTLVTFGGASEWAARENVGLTTARRVGEDAERDTTGISGQPPAEDPAEARRRAQAEQADDLLAVTSPTASNAAPQPVPGSHFDVVLDRTHWLTFGYERPRLTVMMQGSTFYQLSKEGANIAVFPASGPLHRAGFVWPDNTERLLRGTAFVVAERNGSGNVVLFANDPLFRGWWRALDAMLLNAVVIGPSM